MVKETKAKRNYKKKHMAGDVVARREIHKYKVKDEKKAQKKAKIAAQNEHDFKLRQAKQKQVDDFVTQAKVNKGPGYENMSVDDFFNEEFQETQKIKPIASKKAIVPIPKSAQALSFKKPQQMDESEDEFDELEFSDEDEDDSGKEFYDDEIDNEDENGYAQLFVDGVAAEDNDYEDEDEMLDDLEDYDSTSRYGGVFQTQDDFDEDDEDDEELDPKALAARHQKDLQALKKQDPELYKYLLKTQPELLNFKQGDLDQDDKEFKQVKNDIKKAKASKMDTSDNKTIATNIEVLTGPQFNALKSKFDERQYTAKDLLILIKLFKSAVMVRKKTQFAQAKAALHGKDLSQGKLNRMDMKLVHLVSSPLYQHFLKFALRIIPCALLELLYLNNNTPIPFLQPVQESGRVNVINRAVSWKELSIALSDGQSLFQGKWSQLVGWKKVSTLSRTYFLAVFTLLRDAVDSSLIRLILRSILPAIPLLESVQIPVPLLLKRVLHFWTFTTDVEYKSKDKSRSTSTASFRIDNTSRIEAFLLLRRLAVCLPHTSHIKEAVMKGMYQYYVRVCKHVTSYSFPTIIFLTNCVVEIYGIDGVLAYQLCFIYLRQLATQLRTYLINPSSKALRAVYNWQYVNCLRVWGQILSSYAIEPNSALRPLIYPYAQICTTVLTLTQSATYFPVKITISELLSTIMYKCQVYIPIATHLVQILRHPMFAKNKHKHISKHASHLQNELTYKLHINESLLDSLQYKENIASRTIDVLVYHLHVLADSVFYPEYSYPIRNTVKQLVNMVKVPVVLADLKQLQFAMNETLQTILDRRGKFAFSPREVITKNVNPLSLMANSVAINSLNQQAGAPGLLSSNLKQTSLHKLYAIRKAKSEEADRFARQEAKYMAQKEQVDASYDNAEEEYDEDNEDEDDFDDDEEEMPQPKSKQAVQKPAPAQKRSRPSPDDTDDSDADILTDNEMSDQLEDFDMFDDDF